MPSYKLHVSEESKATEYHEEELKTKVNKEWYKANKGLAIKVFYARDGKWYQARIGEYNNKKRKCMVCYENHGKQWLNLNKQRVILLRPVRN